MCLSALFVCSHAVCLCVCLFAFVLGLFDLVLSRCLLCLRVSLFMCVCLFAGLFVCSSVCVCSCAHVLFVCASLFAFVLGAV